MPPDGDGVVNGPSVRIPARGRKDRDAGTPDDAPAVATPTPRRRAALGISGLAVLTLLASALNYVSSLIFSRVLDPVGFGELTAMLALGAIISVPTGAAQTVVAERVAVHTATGRM